MDTIPKSVLTKVAEEKPFGHIRALIPLLTGDRYIGSVTSHLSLQEPLSGKGSELFYDR